MRIVLSSYAALVVLTTALAAQAPPADGDAFTREATDIVTRLDVRAQSLRSSAEDLDEMAFELETRASLASLTRLNMLKEDVERIGAIVSPLERDQSKAPPWQVQLARSITARTRSLTANIDRAINLLRSVGDPLLVPAYQSAAGDIRDQANGLSRTISVYLRWAREKAAERTVDR